MRPLALVPVLLISFSILGQAPLRVPQSSPAASVTQEVGITRFTVEYHSPAVKGRTIWGGLVPYGQIWRAGANEATTLTLTDPVKVEGKELPAGTYAFFAIPGKEHWTLVLSRQGKQWGAYTYKQDQDALRLEVKPGAIPHQEYLQYQLRPEGPDRLRMELRWQTLCVGFVMDVDVKGITWKSMEENLAKASATDWQPWFLAARYCLEQGLDPQRAMAWIDASLKAQENARNLECKARLLEKAGRIPEALPLLDRAIDLSRGRAPEEVVKGLEAVREAWRAKAR